MLISPVIVPPARASLVASAAIRAVSSAERFVVRVASAAIRAASSALSAAIRAAVSAASAEVIVESRPST